MKNAKTIISGLAVAALLSACSSTENALTGVLTVGEVSNTECGGDTRALAHVGSSTLKLTRSEGVVSGELTNLEVSCGSQDVEVKCRQEDDCLIIQAAPPSSGSADGVKTTCSCRVNVYFTIHDLTAQDSYRLRLNGQELGIVSFAGHDVVEIDCGTLAQAYGEGFEYQESLGEDFETVLEDGWYGVRDYTEEEGKALSTLKGNLEVGYYSYNTILLAYDYFWMPKDYSYFRLVLEKEADDVLVLRIEHDGKEDESHSRLAYLPITIRDAYRDSYRIKLNPHTVMVRADDGTEREETVCDFDGVVSRGDHFRTRAGQAGSEQQE